MCHVLLRHNYMNAVAGVCGYTCLGHEVCVCTCMYVCLVVSVCMYDIACWLVIVNLASDVTTPYRLRDYYECCK